MHSGLPSYFQLIAVQLFVFLHESWRQKLKIKKALWKDTWQASADVFEPFPMFRQSASENTFLVLTHAENGYVVFIENKQLTTILYFHLHYT